MLACKVQVSPDHASGSPSIKVARMSGSSGMSLLLYLHFGLRLLSANSSLLELIFGSRVGATVVRVDIAFVLGHSLLAGGHFVLSGLFEFRGNLLATHKLAVLLLLHVLRGLVFCKDLLADVRLAAELKRRDINLVPLLEVKGIVDE